MSRLSTTPDPDAGLDFQFPADHSYFIDTPDGGRLRIEESGTGQPIVLLHGHGASARVFTLLATPLTASGLRVIAVDQRGFGRSSAVPAGFGLRGLVDDAATVIRTLDLRDAVVVGHSMGGAVALGLAIDHPELVGNGMSSLVLVNSAARGPADRPLTRARFHALDWSVVERFGRHPRHGIVLARANFGLDARRSHVEAARAIGLDSPLEGRRGFARQLLGIDLTGGLPDLTLPVLVLAGAADRIVPPIESTHAADLIPGARLKVFPGAGHMLPMERTAEVADLIVAFAASSSAASSPTDRTRA